MENILAPKIKFWKNFGKFDLENFLEKFDLPCMEVPGTNLNDTKINGTILESTKIDERIFVFIVFGRLGPCMAGIRR